MITLITYPKLGPEFSLSPYCCKAAHLLDFSGLPWQREDQNDPRKMPYGKLTAIRTEQGRIIPDTDGIRAYLTEQGTDFQPGLTPAQKAASHALIRMAEDHMYFHLMLDRWEREDVWPVIREKYFHEIPALFRKPVANGLRRSLLRGLHAHGLSRFTQEDRMHRIEQDLAAVTGLVQDHPFLMGDQATLADFSVAPILDAMRLTPVETPLVRRVADDATLGAYIDRVAGASSAKSRMQSAA